VRNGREVDIAVATEALQPGDLALRIPEHLIVTLDRGKAAAEQALLKQLQTRLTPDCHAPGLASPLRPPPTCCLVRAVLEDNTLAELLTTGKLSGKSCRCIQPALRGRSGHVACSWQSAALLPGREFCWLATCCSVPPSHPSFASPWLACRAGMPHAVPSLRKETGGRRLLVLLH
jgi:hypothetical protein